MSGTGDRNKTGSELVVMVDAELMRDSEFIYPELVQMSQSLQRSFRTYLFGDPSVKTSSAAGEAGDVEVVICKDYALENDGSVPESIAIATKIGELLDKPPEGLILFTEDANLIVALKSLVQRGTKILVVLPNDRRDLEDVFHNALGEVCLSLCSFENTCVSPNWRRFFEPESESTPLRIALVSPPMTDVQTRAMSELVNIVANMEKRCQENRLAFVGVKYLKNKVLVPRRLGLQTIEELHVLFQRAFSGTILTVYKVPNKSWESKDLVSACKVNRQHSFVQRVLGVRAA